MILRTRSTGNKHSVKPQRLHAKDYGARVYLSIFYEEPGCSLHQELKNTLKPYPKVASWTRVKKQSRSPPTLWWITDTVKGLEQRTEKAWHVHAFNYLVLVLKRVHLFLVPGSKDIGGFLSLRAVLEVKGTKGMKTSHWSLLCFFNCRPVSSSWISTVSPAL